MTKAEVKERIYNGKCLSDMFEFRDGQECTIYKGEWNPGDEVIYIPDIDLNEICINRPLTFILTVKEIKYVLNCLYTGKDFMELANGNEEIAKELFNYVDWQHPSSAIGYISYNDLEKERMIKTEIIDKIKWNLLENERYTDSKLYNELYDLYEHYNSCIVDNLIRELSKELIDKYDYKSAARILEQFNIVKETFALY